MQSCALIIMIVTIIDFFFSSSILSDFRLYIFSWLILRLEISVGIVPA